ncbi:uncharacterized protein K460DRAFT_362924 [Cucurbitaria berberidis CBS 394.84]|uniref:Uncharacterized protein n=1 Tax=Cucurbitaria berberidis CBS 394.84 TaxID=1168544 RepID=A0A9P4LEP6_9PLEO|nr:uncharacterized protein K460DRAFT_362924 [Cucurbitaria berberidis CBS 394.84]KAF1852158.1 hypothetical protein K460DRAFT_362924 [Cucurbitaria berberidis CBS 394.84]
MSTLHYTNRIRYCQYCLFGFAARYLFPVGVFCIMSTGAFEVACWMEALPAWKLLDTMYGAGHILEHCALLAYMHILSLAIRGHLSDTIRRLYG